MREEIHDNAEKRKTAWMWQILLRGIVTAAFAFCVLFIWHNSLETAEVSAGRSGTMTEIVNDVLASLGKELVTEHFVRKSAHFSEYGLEGVLAVLLFAVYCIEAGKRQWKIALTGLVTAVIDESIQFFSAGRAPDIRDVGIDMAGFVCGMLFMYAAYRLIGKAAWKTWFQNRNRQKRSVN